MVTYDTPRVRFAPSPTGPLHIGGVRTALYNYLFAKKHGGTFVLRLEDTDQSRWVEGAEDYILEALAWHNISPDEGPIIDTPRDERGEFGPYKQSERKAFYDEAIKGLLENDRAYYAFDTDDELEEMRESAKKAGNKSAKYDSVTRNSMRNSLTLSKDEVNRLIESGEPYVIRLKVPRNEEIKFYDHIRGYVNVYTGELDDKILMKSDGMPTYHLANVVDDHAMGITHVIRGEEWLSSTPIHVLLYKYLGIEDEMPEFAHLPLILKPDGNGKLSKRDNGVFDIPVFPLEWVENKGTNEEETLEGFRENGYFPQAVNNILALLGWNPGTDQEIFTLDELINEFSLERVGKGGAKVDVEKAKWIQQQHLWKYPNKDLADMAYPYVIEEFGHVDISKDYMEKICDAMRERMIFLHDIIEANYFFTELDVNQLDARMIKKKWREESRDILLDICDELEGIDDAEFLVDNIENRVRDFISEKEYKFGTVMSGLRLVLTGKPAGPPTFQIMEILGKKTTMSRIKQFSEELDSVKEQVK